jgi:hypothetical protein
MRILFLSLLIVFSSRSSNGQTSLIGEWKPVKVSVYNAFNNTTVISYDENKKKSSKKDNLKQLDSARLIFKNDSTIIIDSYGLLIPTAVSGWRFGDKIGGKWIQEKSTVKFLIGDDKLNYPFFYKIIKETDDSLTLCYTGEDYAETCVMILEFIRQ